MTAGIKAYHLVSHQAEIDFNLYHGKRYVPLIWDGWLFDERVYETLTAVRQNTGWEPNGRYGRPRFVERLGENFLLRPTSPAVDAGQLLPQVLFDFDGVSRPRGAADDIGPSRVVEADSRGGGYALVRRALRTSDPIQIPSPEVGCNQAV